MWNQNDLDETIGRAMIRYGGKDLCRPCLEKVVCIQWAADREKRRKAYEGQSEKADPAAQEAAGR